MKVRFWVKSSRGIDKEKTLKIPIAIVRNKDEMKLLTEEQAETMYGARWNFTDAHISYGYEVLGKVKSQKQL